MTPPILLLALPSETGRVLSIQSHTVQVIALKRIATEYFCDCFLLDGSIDGVVNEIKEAWGDNEGSHFHSQVVDPIGW